LRPLVQHEGCPSLIYSNGFLFLANVGLGFFPIHPLMPSTSWALFVDNNGGWPFELILDMLWYHLRFLECEFRSNSTSKASSRSESCSSLIYSNLTLSLIDVRLGFFPILNNLYNQVKGSFRRQAKGGVEENWCIQYQVYLLCPHALSAKNTKPFLLFNLCALLQISF